VIFIQNYIETIFLILTHILLSWFTFTSSSINSCVRNTLLSLYGNTSDFNNQRDSKKAKNIVSAVRMNDISGLFLQQS